MDKELLNMAVRRCGELAAILQHEDPEEALRVFNKGKEYTRKIHELDNREDPNWPIQIQFEEIPSKDGVWETLLEEGVSDEWLEANSHIVYMPHMFMDIEINKNGTYVVKRVYTDE